MRINTQYFRTPADQGHEAASMSKKSDGSEGILQTHDPENFRLAISLLGNHDLLSKFCLEVRRHIGSILSLRRFVDDPDQLHIQESAHRRRSNPSSLGL
jgi:hypothetical protein